MALRSLCSAFSSQKAIEIITTTLASQSGARGRRHFDVRRRRALNSKDPILNSKGRVLGIRVYKLSQTSWTLKPGTPNALAFGNRVSSVFQPKTYLRPYPILSNLFSW